MSRLDAVNVMGRLLRDRELRHRFSIDRQAVIEELGVDPDQASFVIGLDVHQLDNQAESLVRKRRSEVAGLLPVTWKRLGTDAGNKFAAYADQSPWPEGHRRHFHDAAMFCKFLHETASTQYLASEHQWVRFLASDRSFSLQFVHDLIVHDKERWAIRFCFRRNGVVTNKAIYFRRVHAMNRSLSR